MFPSHDLGGDPAGRQIAENQLLGESNKELAKANKELIDINTKIFNVQSKILELQQTALNEAEAGIQAKRNEILVNGIKEIFNNNALNISMQNLTSSINEGITNRIENQLQIMVDIGPSIADSDRVKEVMKKIATEIYENRAIRSTEDPVF